MMNRLRNQVLQEIKNDEKFDLTVMYSEAEQEVIGRKLKDVPRHNLVAAGYYSFSSSP